MNRNLHPSVTSLAFGKRRGLNIELITNNLINHAYAVEPP
jgi:hypothetical protein